MQPGDVPATYADINTLVQDIGFKPETSVKRGTRSLCRVVQGKVSGGSFPFVRGTEINNSPNLACLSTRLLCCIKGHIFFNMLPFMRLEYELKSFAISVELFVSFPLKRSVY